MALSILYQYKHINLNTIFVHKILKLSHSLEQNHQSEQRQGQKHTKSKFGGIAQLLVAVGYCQVVGIAQRCFLLAFTPTAVEIRLIFTFTNTTIYS